MLKDIEKYKFYLNKEVLVKEFVRLLFVGMMTMKIN